MLWRSDAALGALAAFGSSVTWAYASARYALASREVSPLRVNLVRMMLSTPIFLGAALLTNTLTAGVTLRHLGWLALSTLCSFALADNLFFAAAKRIGVSSALAIASTYPLWAALKGTLIDGEPFGLARASGTLLCVGGVATIIKLSDSNAGTGDEVRDSKGVWLALATSILWGGNTISIKAGSVGLSLATVGWMRNAFALVILGALVLSGRAPGATRPKRGWLGMVPAIIFDCWIGSVIFMYGLSHTDLAVGATLSSLAPLLSLPIAVRMGVEKLSPPKLAAVATTVAGIVLLASS